MKAEDFDALVGKRLHNAKLVLVEKAKCYATDIDRLHNFKVGAFMLGTTPEKYAMSLVTKHWVSLVDKIRTDSYVDAAFIDEKIGDIINYMLLIEALMTERL